MQDLNVNRPGDICPNCWGHYEYDNKIRQALYDEQVDVNNHQKVRTFIQQWVLKYLDGIKLKKDEDKLRCMNCHTHYHDEHYN